MTQQIHIETEQLKEKLLLMASNAEHCVRGAVQSVLDREERLARSIKEQDSVIDQLEKEVDEFAIVMLAQAPLASDLRFIAMAMKISTELERVGDEATTISRRSLELMKESPLKSHVDIEPLAHLVIDMLKASLDAFVFRQADVARKIVLRDKEADAMNKAIYHRMTEWMVREPECAMRCLHYITIAKSLERIGDHASNIAEEVVFLCEAKDIRHQSLA
jgi:phosphate transport system protein